MNIHSPQRWCFALGALAALLSASTAVVAQSYPSKPVRMILGYPPGGGADGVARQIVDTFGRYLGQPVIVEYMPGAGTTLASGYVAKAAPDGYTIYMNSSGIYGSDKVLYKKTVRYEAKDFTPITRWTIAPMILTVSSATGIRSTQDLISRGKAEPGKLTYSSSGNGSPPHLAGMYFESQAGLQMLHVPFKGGAPALQAVAAGDVQLSMGTPPSVMPLTQTGRLTALAVTSNQRSPMFPNLPAVSEAGVKDFDFTFWIGLFGPAGLPADVVAKLFDASVKTLSDPEVKARLAQGGNEASPSASPSEFATWAAADGKKTADLILKAGIAID